MSREVLQYLPDILHILGFITIAALSARQRLSIIERDGNRSQLRHYSEERGFYQSDPRDCRECDGAGCSFQVHHIEPQRTGGEDDPYNLITLYECEHNGRLADGTFADPKTDFVVHPDMIETFKQYRAGNLNAFQEMFEQRSLLLQQGIPYWNDVHDEEFLETAKINTDNAIVRGWKFPQVKHRK